MRLIGFDYRSESRPADHPVRTYDCSDEVGLLNDFFEQLRT